METEGKCLNILSERIMAVFTCFGSFRVMYDTLFVPSCPLLPLSFILLHTFFHKYHRHSTYLYRLNVRIRNVVIELRKVGVEMCRMKIVISQITKSLKSILK